MGGRKVCFITDDGQVGTCVRDDENCLNCDSEYEHREWLKNVRTGNEMGCWTTTMDIQMKTSADYHSEISKQVHVLEQTVYGLRSLASACQRMGFEKIGDELYWRAGNIEEVMEKTDQLILASLKQERENVDNETAQLKQISENIDRKMR